MSQFEKLGRVKSWVLGSIVSNTGSEFLFGFDQQESRLLWLERVGVKYSRNDNIWWEAEDYLRIHLGLQSATPKINKEIPGTPVKVQNPELVASAANMGQDTRPRTVQKSVTSELQPEFPMSSDDPRIVGQTGSDPNAVDVPDDVIASQAAAFLQEGDLNITYDILEEEEAEQPVDLNETYEVDYGNDFPPLEDV